MLDYKKTEDMERMKAEAVKRLKWLKIPELDEAFAKGIVMVSDGTNGDVKLRNLRKTKHHPSAPGRVRYPVCRRHSGCAQGSFRRHH